MPLYSSDKNWFFKYKVYHLPFWFGYHYLWWTLTLGSLWDPIYLIFHSIYAIKFSFYLVFQMAGVYFNLYFLIPRFLEKGKYSIYVGLLTVTVIATAACIVTGYYASAFLSDSTFQELYKTGPENYFYFFRAQSLPSTAASMTLAMSVKLTKNWIQSTRRQQLLEKEKLETELKFLRSQLNPHFLFNAINSIFFLIHKNPAMASSSLAKFSDLLRYQLYECNELQIPLINEVAYLESFIELEKLRQNKSLELHVAIEQNIRHHLAIAPFVLITFTENAFKHVSDHSDKPNRITLNLDLNGAMLRFQISNTVSPVKVRDVVSYGGIGLNNLKRRLDLIYPGQYRLSIDQDQEIFKVALELHLTEIPESQVITKSA